MAEGASAGRVAPLLGPLFMSEEQRKAAKNSKEQRRAAKNSEEQQKNSTPA